MKKENSPENCKTREEHSVKEVILERGLWKANVIPPGATVLEALEVMEEKDVGALVVTEGENVAGVFSERDCSRLVLGRGRIRLSSPSLP